MLQLIVELLEEVLELRGGPGLQGPERLIAGALESDRRGRDEGRG